jgi:hypothetical protein
LLLYSDTLLPVACTSTDPTKTQAAITFRKVKSAIVGHTLTYQLKIEEITKNHRSRTFCLCLQTQGGRSVVTEEFDVKTKRTRPKTLRNRRTIATDFKHQAKRVLSMLEWRLSGYEKDLNDMPDFGQPMYCCPLCKARREHGHTHTCAIYTLLQQ